MSPRQRLHLVPVVRVQFLAQFGDLGVVRPVEPGLDGVARRRQQLLQAASQRRTVRQLDVEFDAVVLAAERRQLDALTISQTLQLSTARRDTTKSTSGYATWFTAGGAIRIAHYDVIDDVITRKL